MKVEIPCEGKEAATILSWVIRGFFTGICECYIQDSVRRPEAYNLSVHMVKTASDISESDKDMILAEIDDINSSVFPQACWQRAMLSDK